MSKHTTLEQLRAAQVRAKAAVDAVSAVAAGAIRSGEYVNNVASFYTSTDCSGTAAFTMNFPEEMFLDQAKTGFVGSFAWSSATYPGSTNPNLDGKPVMVLAVKGEDATANPSYSFLNMETLVDTYSAAAGDGSATVTVSGYTIAVNVNLSTDAGNIITKDSNGKLYAAHQDISGKADLDLLADEYDATETYALGDLCVKSGNLYRCTTAITTAEAWTAGHWTETDVATELAARDTDLSGKADKVNSATSGDLAGLDANGNLTDSGVIAADVVTKIASATENNLIKQTSGGKIADAGIAAGDVVTKIASPTADNLIAQDSNGKIADAGIAKSAVVTAISSPTANNLVKQDANGKIADAGIAAGNVMQKVASATAGHIATLNASGEVVDSGDTVATDTEVTNMLDEVWGSSSSSGSGD